MAPSTIPEIPSILRGNRASQITHELRKKEIEAHLHAVLEYRGKTSCCIRFSLSRKCDCDLEKLLRDEKNLSNVADIVSHIIRLKYDDKNKYSE